MGYSTSGGTKGLGSVTSPFTPRADQNQILTLVGEVGNRRVVTTAERDALTGAKLYEGLEVFNTTTDSVEIYDGSGWKVWHKRWTSYTPTLTNVTGTAPTVTARYAIASGVVTVKVNIALNAANFLTAPLISLPVASVAVIGLQPVGQAIYNDVSTTTWVVGTILLQTTTTVAPLVSQVAGAQVTTQFNVSATAPFTWASGDSMTLQMSYEAA